MENYIYRRNEPKNQEFMALSPDSIQENYSYALSKRKNNLDSKEDYFYISNQPKNKEKIILRENYTPGYEHAMYKKKPDVLVDDDILYGPQSAGPREFVPPSNVSDYSYGYAMYKRKNETENYSSDLNENNLQAIYGAYDFSKSRNCPPPVKEKGVWEGIL